MKHASMLDRMGFHTVGDIGQSRKVTPEGFLVCQGVGIARTGLQYYIKDEVPVDADSTGQIRITRLDEEVFSDRTIASFEGKPVTMDHPEVFVDPENWNKLTVGIVQNVRRGEGIDSDLLMADLLITSADAIRYVNAEKPDLSAGYESDYDQTDIGAGIQRNIIGNHVALVDRGRAGPRVAIKDSQERTPMTTEKKSFLTRVKDAMGLGDPTAAEAAVRAVFKDDGGKKPEGEADTLDSRLAAAEDWINKRKAQDEALSAKELGEKAAREQREAEAAAAKASEVALSARAAEQVDLGTLYKAGDSWPEVVSRAEILSPGIAIPTADSIKTVGALRTFMTEAVTSCAKTNDSVKALVADRDLNKLSGGELLTVFHSAAELVRAINNRRTSDAKPHTRDFGKAVTAASINEQNRAFWDKRKSA